MPESAHPQDVKPAPGSHAGAKTEHEKSPSETVTAAVLVIGDEILSGRTQDTNIAMIAAHLGTLGIQVREARVVPDDQDVIVAAVQTLSHTYTYVFTTGGIGPTHDDITADAIAAAFGVPIDVREDALAILQAHYQPGELTDARLRMARIPDGAVLIENPVSRAPGFQLGNVFVMAGVPMIARAMVEGLGPRLVGGAPMVSRTIAAYLAEGHIAAALEEIQDRFPDVRIGSYPFYRDKRFGVSLVLRSTDEERLAGAVDAVAGAVRALGQEPMEVTD